MLNFSKNKAQEIKKLLRDEELPSKEIIVNGNKTTIEEFRKDPNKFNTLKIPQEYLDRVEKDHKFNNKC